MKNQNRVVIDGNSGSRTIAVNLLGSGVFLGCELNRYHNNLLFAYLFKHPKEFAEDFSANSWTKN